MTRTKCETCNLFYDSDLYASCPHCEKVKAGVGSIPKPTLPHTVKREKPPEIKNTNTKPEEQPEEKKKKGLFGFLKKGKNKKDNENQEPIKPSSEIPVKDSGKFGVYNYNNPAPTPKKDPSDFGGNISGFGIEPSKPKKEKPADIADPDKKQKTEPRNEPDSSNVPNPEPSGNQEPSGSGSNVNSLNNAVQNAGSTQNSTSQKTVARYNFSNSIDPVVGWLVCVSGEYCGESFNLKSESNYIGRAGNMDVSLAKDKRVSREKHCSIIFEPNQKKFYIKSGDSSGLTYVNDEILLSFLELNDYDEITVGDSKFVLVRFAGSSFSWEDYE